MIKHSISISFMLGVVTLTKQAYHTVPGTVYTVPTNNRNKNTDKQTRMKPNNRWFSMAANDRTPLFQKGYNGVEVNCHNCIMNGTNVLFQTAEFRPLLHPDPVLVA